MHILYQKKKYKRYTDFHLTCFPLIYFPSIPLWKTMFINFMHTILVPSEYPKMKALQEHKVSSVPTHSTSIQQKPIHT